MNWMKWIITNVQNGSAKKAIVLKTLEIEIQRWRVREGGWERERWRAIEREMEGERGRAALFSEGQKSSIINFLIMLPWLHVWTLLQDINQKSAWLRERTCLCAGVLFAVIYVPSCVCFAVFSVLHRSCSRLCALIGSVTDWCIIHHLMENDRRVPLWADVCASSDRAGSRKSLI